MESMYRSYKDIAEIRLVYIREAHAAGSGREVDYAVELDITQAKTYDQRCTTADMLLNAKSLTIPFVVDGIQNQVDAAYSAFPDRVFLVRQDGRLAVAAARGPRGFAPALSKANAWLEEFKRTGKEPNLPRDAREPGKDRHIASDKVKSTTATPYSRPPLETKDASTQEKSVEPESSCRF